MLVKIVPKVTQNARVGSFFVEFERRLVERLALRTLSSTVSGIVFFPRILDPGIIGAAPELNSFKRSERSIFVGKSIDFYKWGDSAELGRIALAAENLRDSVAGVRSKQLGGADREALTAAINETEQLLGRGLSQS